MNLSRYMQLPPALTSNGPVYASYWHSWKVTLGASKYVWKYVVMAVPEGQGCPSEGGMSMMIMSSNPPSGLSSGAY